MDFEDRFDYSEVGGGFLTEGDRDYLARRDQYCDEDGNFSDAENSQRNRIRNRIRDALVEGNFVSRLSERDRELIFKEVKKAESDQPLEGGVLGFLRLLYTGLGEELFEACVEQVVEEALLKNDVGAETEKEAAEISVDVSIDIESKPLDAYPASKSDINPLVYRYEQGEDLTYEEMTALFALGEITIEEYLGMPVEEAKEALKEKTRDE